CAFRQRKLVRRFIEIATRGRFRSIKAAPEIDPVQIKLHDLLLAEFRFDPTSQKNLEQFPAKRSLLERETIPSQLLRNGAGTLSHVTRGQINKRRARNSH